MSKQQAHSNVQALPHPGATTPSITQKHRAHTLSGKPLAQNDSVSRWMSARDMPPMRDTEPQKAASITSLPRPYTSKICGRGNGREEKQGERW